MTGPEETRTERREVADQPALVTHCTGCGERVGLKRHIKSIGDRCYAVCYDCSPLDSAEEPQQQKLVTDGGRVEPASDHWKNQDECQECGAGDVPLRAIKLSRGKRDLLCAKCFVVALGEGRVHPNDPRVNEDGSPNLGTPAAPGQRGGRDA